MADARWGVRALAGACRHARTGETGRRMRRQAGGHGRLAGGAAQSSMQTCARRRAHGRAQADWVASRLLIADFGSRLWTVSKFQTDFQRLELTLGIEDQAKGVSKRLEKLLIRLEIKISLNHP